jgi:hypothetical protein
MDEKLVGLKDKNLVVQKVAAMEILTDESKAVWLDDETGWNWVDA